MNCPKCHRDTYSKKWDSCTACADSIRNTAPAILDGFVTHNGQRVAVLGAVSVVAVNDGYPTAEERMSDKPAPGRPRKHESNADRQRAYRERKAKTS